MFISQTENPITITNNLTNLNTIGNNICQNNNNLTNFTITGNIHLPPILYQIEIPLVAIFTPIRPTISQVLQ